MLTKKAQHIAEFAIVLGIMVLSFSAMNLYIKRGLQGRYKQFADSVYTQAFDREGGQYEPYYTQQGSSSLSRLEGSFVYNKSDNEFRTDASSATSRDSISMALPFIEEQE